MEASSELCVCHSISSKCSIKQPTAQQTHVAAPAHIYLNKHRHGRNDLLHPHLCADAVACAAESGGSASS
eukprot:1158512-Pelagomonas_calceolata.AAC.2